MASLINSTDIDAEYPVAGVDNDSQGFRDNFSTVKNSLATAKSEITALQDNTAKKNADNDFNGNKIQEADFIANTETLYASGNITASQNISFNNGHYQTIQVGGNISLTLADWPAAGKMARMRLHITGDGEATYTVTFVAGGGGEFKSHADWPGTFSVTSQTNPIIVDFWTVTGGLTVLRQYHGSFT